MLIIGMYSKAPEQRIVVHGVKAHKAVCKHEPMEPEKCEIQLIVDYTLRTEAEIQEAKERHYRWVAESGYGGPSPDFSKFFHRASH